MKNYLASVAAVAWVLAGCSENPVIEIEPPPAPPPASAPALMLQSIAAIDLPVLVTAPPGDSRLFILEKQGLIRIMKNGTLLPAPFLDITSLVTTSNEQGILGLAFHPGYSSNGVFVIDYTDLNGDTRVASYKVSADADVANPASARILLSIDQPFSNHNGGGLEFGPDGMLYISSGDGGGEGDPSHQGQTKNDLFGSLLRLQILTDGTMQVPTDNPFVGQSGARGELWNVGLRNPWRFSFDRANGDLYIADVGQGVREEVNVSPAFAGGGKGLNYGWSMWEGTHCFTGNCSTTGVTQPLVEYSHAQGCSIIGGYVYRGTAIPELQGTYFYADYCQTWVRSFKYSAGAVTEPLSWDALTADGSIFSFGQDAAGELYICARGNVFKIVRAP